MSYIRFKGGKEVLQANVMPQKNIVTLSFAEEPVVSSAGFEAFLDADCELRIGDYLAYTTVFRNDEVTAAYNGYQLSNDGSVYTVPVPTVTFSASDGGSIEGEKNQSVTDYGSLVIPTPVPDENYTFSGWVPEIKSAGVIEKNVHFTAVFQYVPTLEELKAAKKSEVAAACNAIITAGIDVALPDGSVEHFSLEENSEKHDQLNLFGKQVQLAAGATQLEYHQDDHPCRYYTAEEMQQIITAAVSHVSFHTTYCNSLNMWIAGAESADEVNGVYYGAEIPEEYRSKVLSDYMAAMAAQNA